MIEGFFKSSSGALWARAEVLVLAHPKCTACLGLGAEGEMVCGCVFRKIFREAFRRFQRVRMNQECCRTTCDFMGTYYARNSENFAADFILVGRRHLAPREYGVFDLHFVQGAEQPLCSLKLKISSSNYFNVVKRVEEKLGRIFRELRPYSLHPVNAYFSGGKPQPALLGSERTGVKPSLSTLS